MMNGKLDENKIIGIDGRCLLDANYTGVSEYTIVLIKKLLKDYPDKKFIIFLNSFKSRGAQERLLWLRKYKNVQIKHYHFPSKLLNFSVWIPFPLPNFSSNPLILLSPCQKNLINTPYLCNFFNVVLNKIRELASKIWNGNGTLWFFRYPKLDKMLGGVDVFIAPNISFLAISKNAEFILTVHDLSFERFRETFSWKRRFWHFIINPRKLCQRADEIWTVSDSTKWDLENLYNIPSEKIKVKPIVRNLKINIGDNKNESKLNSVRDKYNLPKKFILYLGTIEPRKNIVNLVIAFEYLKKNKKIEKKCKLVIAGQLGWRYKEIVECIKQSKFKKDIVLTNFVNQKDKPYFYQLAMIFVYPSLFEGFGIPVLEAMASGVPVITSNNSSIPEVVGKAGIMIDPDRVDDLVDAIELIINDEKLREYYIREGFKQAELIMGKSAKIELL